MSVLRSYFNAQATLLRDNPTNNSRNPIIELSYGGSASSGTTKIGRYIFRVDLSGLQREITTKTLTSGNTDTHTLHFKNVIAQAPDLAGHMMDDAKRGAGLTVNLYVLPQDFDEGTGYDYLYFQGLNNRYDAKVEAPNWTHRKTNTPWGAPGAINMNADTLNLVDTFRLEMGNEDMVFDVTDYVNSILFGGVTHNGFILTLTPDIEALETEQRRVITFFSKYTQSFFEPYLETLYGEQIWESRCDFPLDATNHLYLHTTKPIELVEKVEIRDHDDRLIIVKNLADIIQLGPNLYRITVKIESTAYPDLIMFTDTWYCKANGRVKKVEQNFTLVEEELVMQLGEDETSDFWFGLNGIRHNETIVRSPVKRRVVVNAKRLFSGTVDTNPDLSGLTYRLYILSGKYPIEVIPKTPVNKLQDLVFFDLDLSWLIPQQYFLEVQMELGGREIKTQQPVKFRVVAS